MIYILCLKQIILYSWLINHVEYLHICFGEAWKQDVPPLKYRKSEFEYHFDLEYLLM